MVISLLKQTATPPVAKPLISLAPLVEAPAVTDEEMVTERTQRYDYALGAMTPGAARLQADIRAGNEQYIRENAARQADMSLNAMYTKQVEELARMGDTDTLSTIINTPPIRSNPNTIIEEDYAARLLADIYFNDPEGPQTVEELSPMRQRGYERTYDAYVDAIARDEIIQGKYEEYSAEWESRNFLTNVMDFVETLIPFKDWSNFETILRDTPADPSLSLQGNTLLDQVMYLHALPLDQFEESFARAVDTLARVNLNNAFYFIQAVQTYSRSDQSLDNLFTLLDLGGLAVGTARTVGGVARIGASAVRGARAARTAENIVDNGNTLFPERAVEAARTGTARELTPEQEQMLEDYDAFTEGLDTADVEMNFEDVRRQYLETNPGVEEALDIRLQRRMNDVRQANALNESTSARTATTGDIETAVVTEMVDEPITFTTPKGTTRGMVRRLFSFQNPSETVTGSGRAFSMARDLLSRSTSRINRVYEDLTKTRMTIARLTEEEALAGYRAAVAFGRKEFSRFGNVIRDITRIDAEDTGDLNIDQVKFTLGRSDGSIFSTAQSAGTYATKVIKLPKGSYKIEPVPGGYGISVTRAVDETQDIRNVTIATQNQTRQAKVNAGPLSIANEMFGFSQNEARKKLVHLVQRESILLSKLAKEMRLGRGDRGQFTQFLENIRNANILPGVSRGQVTPTTMFDFTTAWRGYFGTAPSVAQKRAYYAWIRASQIEWGLKNVAKLRGKMRKGIHEVSLTPRGKSKVTTDFEGQTIKPSDFSFNDLDYRQGILIYDSSKTTHEFHRVGDLTPVQKQQILAAADASNQIIIRVWNRAEFPFKGMGENRVVDYVITGDYLRKPLKNEQIPFNPNGNLIYDNKFQIKQLNTGYNNGRKLLYGERRVSPADSEKEGKELAQHLNTARNLYAQAKANRGSLVAFQNHVRNNLPHIPVKELQDAFDNGVLSLTDEFMIAKQEESLLSSNHAKAVRDEVGDHSDLSDDTSQGVSIESSNKPLFDNNIGEVVSPAASIERNLQSAIKTGAVADYITKAAEQFVKEFGSILKNKPRDLKENPIGALVSPQWVEGGIDRKKLKMAKRFQRSVSDLLGYQTPLRRAITSAEDTIYESIYNMPFGGKGIARLASRFPSLIVDDAPVFLRAVAFNLSMGFWNPYQLFKQVQTLSVTAAITSNPGRAMKGMGAASLMWALNRSSRSAGMIQNIANMSRKLGWDPDDFKELYDLADRSGLSIIRGEHAFKDRWLDPPIIQSGVHKVLHNSTMFFRSAEEMVRLNGLAVAYREWRKANPNKAFRRLDQESVLRRSDDLTANMTNASNAIYNGGGTVAGKILAFPTQFLSYQLRLMELFWGKRLTFAEKTRLFLYQSAIYGLPAGATVATGILPLPEMIRKNLVADGVTFDSVGAQVLQGGLFGVLSYLSTGHETTFAQEYGPGGIDLFMDAVAGDATFRELILGPSGSKLTQIWDSAYPFLHGLKRMLGLAPSEGQMRLGWSDVAGVLRNIATFNNIERAVYAINTASYLRRNGEIAMGYDPNGDGNLGEDPTGTDRFMNPTEVGWLAALGVDPAVINDEFLISLSMQDYDAMQQKPREQLMDVFRRQIELANNSEMSPEQKSIENDRLIMEAQVWTAAGNFTPDQLDGIIAQVARDGGATYANMWMEFSLTTSRANPATADTRRQNFIDSQRPNLQLSPDVLRGPNP